MPRSSLNTKLPTRMALSPSAMAGFLASIASSRRFPVRSALTRPRRATASRGFSIWSSAGTSAWTSPRREAADELVDLMLADAAAISAQGVTSRAARPDAARALARHRQRRRSPGVALALLAPELAMTLRRTTTEARRVPSDGARGARHERRRRRTLSLERARRSALRRRGFSRHAGASGVVARRRSSRSGERLGAAGSRRARLLWTAGSPIWTSSTPGRSPGRAGAPFATSNSLEKLRCSRAKLPNS